MDFSPAGDNAGDALAAEETRVAADVDMAPTDAAAAATAPADTTGGDDPAHLFDSPAGLNSPDSPADAPEGADEPQLNSPATPAQIAGSDAAEDNGAEVASPQFAGSDAGTEPAVGETEAAVTNGKEVGSHSSADLRASARAMDSLYPKLLVGSKLNKEVALRPDRWVRFGRAKESQLLLDNPGVSRQHCRLRWDSRRRAIEFRETSNTGTKLNGKVVKGTLQDLEHADKIRIDGKGQHFEVVIDMRNVSSGLPDPRSGDPTSPEKRQQKLSLQLRERKATLEAKLHEITAAIDEDEKIVFEKEKLFYEIATRRRLRAQQDQKRQKAIEDFDAETVELDANLGVSRLEWAERQRNLITQNAEDVAPLTQKVNLYQEMLEKLQMKRNELERSIHPARYGMIGGMMGSSGSDPARSSPGKSPRNSQDTPGHSDSSPQPGSGTPKDSPRAAAEGESPRNSPRAIGVGGVSDDEIALAEAARGSPGRPPRPQVDGEEEFVFGAQGSAQGTSSHGVSGVGSSSGLFGSRASAASSAPRPAAAAPAADSGDERALAEADAVRGQSASQGGSEDASEDDRPSAARAGRRRGGESEEEASETKRRRVMEMDAEDAAQGGQEGAGK